MTSEPILDPEIPYVGEVPGGLAPGKMLKIRGMPPPDAGRFAINYQLGPNLNPRDDIAIHLSPRFSEGIITRNHINSMSWGPEENHGPMVIQAGQGFEVIILCEPLQYKIAINGRHYTEFAHRLPYQKVTHLVIDGDVAIKSIIYESIGGAPRASAPDVPAVDFGPPAPGGIYPSLNPQTPAMPQGAGGYGPPPSAYGGPGYHPPSPYGYQPGHEKAEEEEVFGGCLDKVGLAVGGLIAAGGVAAAMHHYNKKKKEQEEGHEPEHEKTDSSKTESESGFGGLGALGAALASSLASNALQGNGGQGHAQGYPSQDAGGGGMLGSLLGALGGGGGGGAPQPAYAPQQPSNDAFGGFGSILSGVLSGGGHQQPPAYSSGGYQPSGGYSAQSQPGGGDFLSSIGGAIGSSFFSSALDGLTKNKSHDDHPSSPPPQYHNYGPPRSDPPPPPPQYHNYGPPRSDPPPPPPPRATTPPASGGGKLSAAEISKGLGLSDDED